MTSILNLCVGVVYVFPFLTLSLHLNVLFKAFQHSNPFTLECQFLKYTSEFVYDRVKVIVRFIKYSYIFIII